jgi:hypothetical protein
MASTVRQQDILQKVQAKGLRNIAWSKMPTSGIVLVTGFRGEGKTALSWWMADFLRKEKGYPTNVIAYGLHKNGVKLLPKWAQNSASKPSELAAAKPSIIVADEAAFSANARRSMSDDSVQLMKLFAICRHKGHLMIFISQTSRQVDIQIVEQSDLLLMKKPSALQVKTARRELREQTQAAFTLLSAKRDSKASVYVYDPKTDAGKLLAASMPKWWTKKLSTMYAGATL